MLFNSYEFIFLFMPVVFAGFFIIARKSHQGSIAWLSLASIFFYAYWSIYALPVIVASICVNYWLGLHLSNPGFRYRQPLLVFAITLNLFTLGYFKYANFFIANTNALRNAMGIEPIGSLDVILPIGISFFTFTQIAFLVDSYQDKVKERSFLQYLLFVSFFPHLLAGPVLHHKQMMPQFSDPKTFSIDYEKIKLGIAIFTIGLAKKVIIADSLSGSVDAIFNSSTQNHLLNFWVTWLGALSYTFQLYFDFSGYSDMAVGASLFFGIWLPFNFNSPFKATSIIDFWQRWHMTLTKYVGEYLYAPIALKFMRLGQGKTALIEILYSLVIPTVLIFLILGLWHGANWTYVVFGGMHGLYIVINHLWRMVFPLPNKKNKKMQAYRGIKKIAGWSLTFISVIIANVMFRADSISTACEIYKGMLGLNGFNLIAVRDSFLGLRMLTIILTLSFLIILTMPSIPTMLSISEKNTRTTLKLISPASGIILGIIFIVSIMSLDNKSPFLYFQF